MSEYDDDELFNEENDTTTYSIKNMKKFCEAARNIVAEDLKGDISTKKNKMSNNDLDSFITIKQVENIVRTHCIQEDSNKCCINIDIYLDILNDISSHMWGSALAKLAADGFLESAWDNDLNDMVFWLKDADTKN